MLVYITYTMTPLYQAHKKPTIDLQMISPDVGKSGQNRSIYIKILQNGYDPRQH